MSHVTNIIVFHTGYENKRKGSIKNFLNSFFEDGSQHFWKAGEDFQVGGTRVWEASTYMAALNHVNLPDLISHIESIDWRYPEYVMVLIKDPHDEDFSIYKIKENKLQKQ